MEPQDDHFTGEQYNQLENFLMEGKEFPLLELPQSNPSQSNNKPSHLQQGESNRDKMTRDANSGGHVTNAQHTISPTDNNDCLPSEFSDHTAQPKNKGLSSSGNSTSSIKITYKVQPPGPGIQPVWSSPAQTSIFGKPVGAAGSPNNPPPPAPTTAHLDKYSNPIQPLMSNTNTNSGQISTSPSPATTSTHQPQIINPPPIPVVVSPNNMPPPQVPCNNNDNNTLQAPAQPSTNHNHLQHSQQIHNNYEGYDQLASPPNPYPPAVVDQLVANTNSTSSSSIAFRFAATMQGASTGNMRTQYPLPSGTPPSGFMSFQQQCVSTYVQGGTQMVDAASSGNGVVQTPFPPHMALAGGGGGGQETGLLPMYSTASFHDLALIAQRINNKNDNSTRKKQKRQEGSATKNPRGRPKGSVSKKRNPAPQWEDVRYDLHELEQHVKKPYNVRRAEWQDLKQAGALTAASRAQMMSNSLPAGGGDQQQMAAFEGGQAAHAGWNNYYPLPMNNIPSSYDRQGQNGDLPAVGIPKFASEVVHPAPPISQGRTASTVTFGDAAPSSADNGINSMPADPNPSKFWSFGTNNLPGTMMTFPSQNASNNGNNDQNMIIIHPGSAEQRGKQAIENHMSLLQSGSSAPSVVPVDVPSRNNSCVEFGTAGSSSNTDQDQLARGTNIDNNPNTVNHVGGMMRGGNIDQSAREPQAVVAAANNNNTFWCGRHQSTYINFENGCYGVSVQGQGRATNSQGTNSNRTSVAPSLYDAASAAQGNTSSCNKQPYGSSTNYAATSTQNTAVETNYSNYPTSLNHSTSVEPMLMPPAASNQLVAVADQYSISVSDYFSDYDGMQLTDEDDIACALREQIISQTTTAQPIQQHVTPLPTHFSSLHHPMPGGVVVEKQAIEHQIACQLPATPIIPQPIQSGGAAPGQQVVSTWGVSQNNYNSFGQAAHTFSSEYPPLQSNFQPNLFAQYQPVQDGRGSEHQAYMQQKNNHDHANNNALSHQQIPTAHQSTTRSQNIPRITGPTDFFNYQQRLQQQQQADPPVDGPRPYAMPPPPGSGYMINTPLMQQHYYQYGGNGDLRPPKTTRRRQTQPHYPVIDFNQCAVTPDMFQEMINDGSVDSVLGSDLWAGLNHDAYSIMVTADPTLVLDQGRLQERIARLNSGMLPIPNLFNCLRMNMTGYSAPQAPNRLMGNNNMMNYAPPTGMQQNPTIQIQQGHGVATGAENYNFSDPNARVPHLVMNANNIPSVQYQYQYQQQPNNLQVAQMNVNMQQGQTNFGYWHEYPAPTSSGQRLEEMMQLVPVNQPSMQDNVNYNPPFSSSFASGIPPPPNTLQALNQAYNNTMHGVPYASGGPVCSTSANEK